MSTEQFLKPLHIKINDNTRVKNRTAYSLIEKGVGYASKYIFITLHISYYIDTVFKPPRCYNDAYFHIRDQHNEAKLEVIHSVLLARLGMPHQAINVLRRSFEAAIYGSFFATTFYYGLKGEVVNPFVLLMDSDLWVSRYASSAIRMKDLKDLIDDLSKKSCISNNQSKIRILTEFTDYYLMQICNPICDEHYGREMGPICQIQNDLNIRCHVCNKVTSNVLLEKPVTTDLMIDLIDSKLKRKGLDGIINLKSLYNALSPMVHPNPEGHQHTPSFAVGELKGWLMRLRETLTILVWLYVRTIEYVGYKEETTVNLMDSHQFDLARLKLAELKSICRQLVEVS